MPHQCTNCDRTFPDGSKEMLSGCPDCGGNKFQFVPAGVVDSSPGADPTAGSTDSSVTDRDGSAADTSDRRTDHPDDGFPEWPETARRPEDRTASAPSPGSSTTGPTDEDASRTDAGGVGDTTPTGQAARTDAGDLTRTDAGDTAQADAEDTAQADARSEIVTREELPDPPEPREDGSPSDGREDGPPSDGRYDGPPADGRVVSEPAGERPSLDELREELNDQFESIKIVNPGQYELNLMELYDREEYIVSLQEDGRYVIDVPDSWRQGE